MSAEQGSGGGAPRPEPVPITGPVVTPPAPPRLRRRPLTVLAGVALVIAGALVAAWAWVATSDTSPVVAVRGTVMRGEVIGAQDLMTVQVSADPALQVVPGSQLETVVGKRAARDMPAGSLLTPESVTPEVTPATGMSVVGLALGPATMPGEPLLVGDPVRVVATAGGQGDPATVEEGLTLEAEVVNVAGAVDVSGQMLVSVLVPESSAPTLARWAASGRVALVLDSREG